MIQKNNPVRPRARDQKCSGWRRVARPIRPTTAAIRKAAIAAHTQAPCRYTIRTLLPNVFSDGPTAVNAAITNRMNKSQNKGDRVIGTHFIAENGIWNFIGFPAAYKLGNAAFASLDQGPRSRSGGMLVLVGAGIGVELMVGEALGVNVRVAVGRTVAVRVGVPVKVAVGVVVGVRVAVRVGGSVAVGGCFSAMGKCSPLNGEG